MRRAFTLFFSLLVLGLLSFIASGQSGRVRPPVSPSNTNSNSNSVPKQGGKKKSSTPSTSRRLTLDEQARQEAERVWNSVLTKCGDSYYWAHTGASSQTYGASNIYLHQGKNQPTILVKGAVWPKKILTEADKLNGIKPSTLEWVGESTIRFRPYRSGQSDGGKTDWNLWINEGGYTIRLLKDDGNWTINPTPMDSYKAVPVDCNDVLEKVVITPVQAPYINSRGFLVFDARYSGWFSLGHGPLTISGHDAVNGKIYINQYCPVNAIGNVLFTTLNCPTNIIGGTNSLLPGINVGALLIKIGSSGIPYQLMPNDNVQYYYSFKTTEEIFIAINDFDYSDNKEQYVIGIKR